MPYTVTSLNPPTVEFRDNPNDPVAFRVGQDDARYGISANPFLMLDNRRAWERGFRSIKPKG